MGPWRSARLSSSAVNGDTVAIIRFTLAWTGFEINPAFT
jgi:hypothetical protein